ncbi:ATP-binding protein [Streptomyces sp. NPDC004542]|uniref:ATP-binding protein n=1 Tax=Streptomyces sp. NPDC004542 TaxID=3154281 RepID=UPI0033A00458
MTDRTASTPTVHTEVFVCELDHRASSVATARHTARTVLAGWSVDEDAVYDAMLIVSELVTNAVEHALPPVALHLCRGRVQGRPVIRIKVTDGGAAPHPGPWTASCQPDEHGRGGGIVSMLGIDSSVDTRDGESGQWADLAAA